MTYIVGVREIWIQSYMVEANSKEEAIKLVKEGNYSKIETFNDEYSHTLHSDLWTAEKYNSDDDDK